MKKLFTLTKQSLTHFKEQKKKFGMVVIAAGLLSLPVTLLLVDQQQDLRQRASTITDAGCPNINSDGTTNACRTTSCSLTGEKTKTDGNSACTSYLGKTAYCCTKIIPTPTPYSVSPIPTIYKASPTPTRTPTPYKASPTPTRTPTPSAGCPNVNSDGTTNACRTGGCINGEQVLSTGNSACTSYLGTMAYCCKKIAPSPTPSRTPTPYKASPTPTRTPTPSVGCPSYGSNYKTFCSGNYKYATFANGSCGTITKYLGYCQ